MYKHRTKQAKILVVIIGLIINFIFINIANASQFGGVTYPPGFWPPIMENGELVYVNYDAYNISGWGSYGYPDWSGYPNYGGYPYNQSYYNQPSYGTPYGGWNQPPYGYQQSYNPYGYQQQPYNYGWDNYNYMYPSNYNPYSYSYQNVSPYNRYMPYGDTSSYYNQQFSLPYQWRWSPNNSWEYAPAVQWGSYPIGTTTVPGGYFIPGQGIVHGIAY